MISFIDLTPDCILGYNGGSRRWEQGLCTPKNRENAAPNLLGLAALDLSSTLSFLGEKRRLGIESWSAGPLESSSETPTALQIPRSPCVRANSQRNDCLPWSLWPQSHQ